jgi:hypothetical protein
MAADKKLIKQLKTLADHTTRHAGMGLPYFSSFTIHGAGNYFDGVTEVQPVIIITVPDTTPDARARMRFGQFTQWVKAGVRLVEWPSMRANCVPAVHAALDRLHSGISTALITHDWQDVQYAWASLPLAAIREVAVVWARKVTVNQAIEYPVPCSGGALWMWVLKQGLGKLTLRATGHHPGDQYVAAGLLDLEERTGRWVQPQHGTPRLRLLWSPDKPDIQANLMVRTAPTSAGPGASSDAPAVDAASAAHAQLQALGRAAHLAAHSELCIHVYAGLVRMLMAPDHPAHTWFVPSVKSISALLGGSYDKGDAAFHALVARDEAVAGTLRACQHWPRGSTPTVSWAFRLLFSHAAYEPYVQARFGKLFEMVDFNGHPLDVKQRFVPEPNEAELLTIGSSASTPLAALLRQHKEQLSRADACAGLLRRAICLHWPSWGEENYKRLRTAQTPSWAGTSLPVCSTYRQCDKLVCRSAARTGKTRGWPPAASSAKTSTSLCPPRTRSRCATCWPYSMGKRGPRCRRRSCRASKADTPSATRQASAFVCGIGWTTPSG